MSDFITAQDIINLSKCRRIVYLDRHGDPALRVEPSEYELWLMEQGIEFEQQAIADYDLYVVHAPEDPQAAFGATLQLMQHGADMIYQGTLLYEGLHGRPDLLMRVDGGASRFGGYYYRPVDIKSARRASDSHRHQVMFYCYLLHGVQGFAPDGALLLNNGPEGSGDAEVEVPYAEDEILALINEVIDTIDGDEPPPFITSACQGCRWRKVCLPLAEEMRDVSLLPGIRRDTWQALHASGLHTLDQVAALTLDELMQVDGMGRKGAPRLLAHARAYVEQRPVLLQPPRLAPPAPGEAFFDIEGFSSSNKNVDCYYLLGLLVRRGDEYVFEYDLAERPEDEREMWFSFLERVDALDGPVYHYGPYERTAIGRLVERHGGGAPARRFLDRFVDLHRLVKSSVALPLHGYSLKQVAPWLGFEWTGFTQAAPESIVEYHRWLETGERQHLEHVIVYNRDDVLATRVVRDWLLNFSST